MSVDDQRDYYEDADKISSDPFGFIDRDNRNHRRKAELVTSMTTADADDPVLEVGCGHGLHARKYAERFEYTGIDLSPSLVRETRSRIDDGTVMTANALDLPFDDNRFEAVVGGAILHHIPDPKAALTEWQRVVRDGGDVTLIEPNYLFPKDLVTAHIMAQEQHKTMMAPWRIRDILEDVSDSHTVRPCIYSPPWPTRYEQALNKIDDTMRSIPGARWMSQMLLLQIHV